MTKKLISTKSAVVLLAIIIIAAGFMLFPQPARNESGRLKSYYSGDAINFEGRLLVASTNMKGVEIFEIKDNKIVLLNSFSSYDAIQSGAPNFNDAIFKIEADKLYLYLSDGRYLYKYNITDINEPVLAGQKMDNSYDWFMALSHCGDNFISLGSKGLKIWNSDFEVFYLNNEIINEQPKNVQLDPACKFVLNINGDKVEIFDRFENRSLPPIKINARENHFRKILFADNGVSFYIADDGALKQFDYEGRIIKSFEHISTAGYDVIASADPNYLYFSDGLGVVKLLKTNLEPVNWAYTTDLGGPNGWAMNILAVKNSEGEKLIVFNNGNILVLDENLEKIDSHESTEPDDSPRGLAAVSVDKSITVIGEWVNLNGRGFLPHEDLKISLGDSQVYAKADDYGNLRYVMQTPPVKFGAYDLTVSGLASERTAAVNFQVVNR